MSLINVHVASSALPAFPCCPPLLPAEDPGWYFAMSTPEDMRDALSDITNIAGMLSVYVCVQHF
jgi:hypothetical protein